MGHRRAPNLKRAAASRGPKQLFILFCEGKNTEPDYFAHLRRSLGNALIEVRTVGGAGVPLTIAKLATEKAAELKVGKKRRKLVNSFERDDQVWAVFDRDTHPHFDEAIACCEKNGVLVARSNPCFEVWLILHECDYNRPGNSEAVQDYFSKVHNVYDKRGAKVADCAALLKNLELAEKRAECLLKLRRKERAPFGEPSTTVFLLTRAIKKAAVK